jgi:hypothetical protein
MTLTPAPAAHARVIALVQIVLAAAVLLWPLLVAGRPTLFADTGAYWRQGRTVVVQGLGLDRAAPDPFDLTLGGQVVGHQVVRDPKIASSFLGARSAIYGVFLFASQRIGTLWLTAALQALCAAAVIHVVWRAAAPRAPAWTYAGLMAGLAAATSLPFYAGFAMPDVFAGLDLLIAAALTFYWDRLGRRTRLALWLLLAVSLSFHASHLMLMAATAAAAAYGLWRLGASAGQIRLRVGVLAAAIAAAAIAAAGAGAGMQTLTGTPAHSPPFLTARLLADGPGRTYLRRACAHAEPFRLCRFKDLPLDRSDAILWWNDPRQGVFMTSPLAERLALEAEQPRFVRAVIAADPLGVAGAGLRDFAVQLASFFVDDPLHDPCQMTRFWYWSQSTAKVLVVDPGRCGAGPALTLSPTLLFALHAMALVAAGFGLFRLALGRRCAPAGAGEALDDEGRIVAAAALIVAAIAANAAICGVLSGPFARYEARLIWLLPMFGLLAACLRAPTAVLASDADRRRSAAGTPADGLARG